MVYPRTHGETKHQWTAHRQSYGLSPYTRGNHTASQQVLLESGSIPVHTGKPVAVVSPDDKVTVYPRTHGETNMQRKRVSITEGLSPYTRGNRNPVSHKQVAFGSIPVHTGKPVDFAPAST